MCVCVSVCVSVCVPVFTFELPFKSLFAPTSQIQIFKKKWYLCFSLCLTVFLPQLPEVQWPNFLDFQNPWGKVMERSGLRIDNFCSKRCKIAAVKKLLSTFNQCEVIIIKYFDK